MIETPLFTMYYITVEVGYYIKMRYFYINIRFVIPSMAVNTSIMP